MDDIIKILADELGKKPEHIENVIKLIDEGNTIPFIARYRKELHGAMDDTRCVRSKSALRICVALPSGGRRSRPPLPSRASSPRSLKRR